MTALLLLLACRGGPDDPPDTHTDDPDTDVPDGVRLEGVAGWVDVEHLQEPANSVWIDVTLETAAAVDRLECVADADGVVEERLAYASADVATAHRLGVSGLLASTTYDCTVTVGPDTSAPFTVETRALPERIGQLTFTIEENVPGATAPGFTLFDVLQVDGDALFEDHFLVVADHDGRVRWYKYIGPELADIDFRVVDGEGVFSAGGGKEFAYPLRILDPMGRELDVLTETEAGQINHSAEVTATSYWYITGDGVRAEPCIHERRRDDHALVWEWCAEDNGVDTTFGINSLALALDRPEPQVMFTPTSEGRIVNVGYPGGEVRWVMGAGAFAGMETLPEWLHDVQFHEVDGGTALLIYDNGVENDQSRALEIVYDEVAMTASIRRSWTEPGWYESRWGSIQDVAGRWLVGMGHDEVDHPDSNDTSAAEVDPDSGEVLWRLRVAPSNFGMYRAKRWDGCAVFGHVGYCPEG